MCFKWPFQSYHSYHTKETSPDDDDAEEADTIPAPCILKFNV